MKIFAICHWCQWCRWCTLSCEYLREFSKKFETALLVYSGAWGKLIHEKKQKSKISWHCPFKCMQFSSHTRCFLDELLKYVDCRFKPAALKMLNAVQKRHAPHIIFQWFKISFSKYPPNPLSPNIGFTHADPIAQQIRPLKQNTVP